MGCDVRHRRTYIFVFQYPLKEIDMPTFEVIMYNEEVRKCLKGGDRHKQLSDDWGDSHYIEIKAENEDSALAKIEIRYPASDGFVVEGISQT